jgi:hypothetical protein
VELEAAEGADPNQQAPTSVAESQHLRYEILRTAGDHMLARLATAAADVHRVSVLAGHAMTADQIIRRLIQWRCAMDPQLQEHLRQAWEDAVIRIRDAYDHLANARRAAEREQAAYARDRLRDAWIALDELTTMSEGRLTS